MQLTVLFPAPDGIELAAGDGVGEGVVALHIFVLSDRLGPLGQHPDGLQIFDAVGLLVFLQARRNLYMATIDNAVALVNVLIGKQTSTHVVQTVVVYRFAFISRQ